MSATRRFWSLVVVSIALAACAAQEKPKIEAPRSLPPSAAAPSPVAALEIPAGRLPRDVSPLAYTLELTIDPKLERFSGRVQIAVSVASATDLVWLHGRELHVQSARAQVGSESIAATYTQRNEDGVASLRFAKPLPAGRATLELIYDTAFDRQLKGIYRVDTGGESYAFSQFEPISARLAFPCFDEPSWKTPFDVWLTVPAQLTAASNAPAIGEEAAGENKRVHFAQTKPLPTYLVAFAVGPLDVVVGPTLPPNAVRSAPLPLRGLAVKGGGALLAHALADAGSVLAALERYAGRPYPYEKLDLVSVPDFGAGAMENAGLVTFRDWLLQIDPAHASEHQLRASSYVIAHELAHQWVGDLVTMVYWDDLWLNEAFATWLGYRVTQELHPEQKPLIAAQGAVLDAMQADSRKSARMILQPILRSHDILNAFDGITYNKGGAVLAMFERFLGPAVFQKGLQRYLNAHAFGNATTDDFLDALSAEAGRDVKTPFKTFLTQVGVPLVKTSVSCAAGSARLELTQSRYVPLGSSGAASELWQIPVCARYGTGKTVHESCTLLTSAQGFLPLEGGCPEWSMPNAEAAGYFRLALAPQDLEALRKPAAWKQLSARERMAVADSLRAGFESGTLDATAVFAAFPQLVADDNRTVVSMPMPLLRLARNEMVSDAQRPAIEARVRALYGSLARRLGYREAKGDDGDRKLLRADVLTFLADVGRDPSVRAKLVALGKSYLGLGGNTREPPALHPQALPSDLTDVAVRLVVEDGDMTTFDTSYERFKTTNDVVLRARLLQGLASVRDARSAKALALALDPALRVNEVLTPLRAQLADLRTRDAAWAWFEANFDAVAKRLSANGAGGTPWFATSFCSEAMAKRVQTFFAPRIDQLTGGPRALAGATEALEICAATVRVQGPGVQALLSKP